MATFRRACDYIVIPDTGEVRAPPEAFLLGLGECMHEQQDDSHHLHAF